MERSHVLIVDTEKASRTTLVRSFQRSGFQVSTVRNGHEVCGALEQSPLDLLILDAGLPDVDGLSLLRGIREQSNLGIIVCSRRHDDMERIVFLESGADDYLFKPFNEREVLARARSIIRRTKPSLSNRAGIIRFGHFELNAIHHTLTRGNGDEIALTRGEFDLLTRLARQPGTTLSREQLQSAVSNRRYSDSDRTVDNLVSRIRRKIEVNPKRPEYLITERGFGYRLVTPSTTNEKKCSEKAKN